MMHQYEPSGGIPKYWSLKEILSGFIIHTDLGFWYMSNIIRGKAEKVKEYRPDTQGDWKRSLSPEISGDFIKNIPYII